MRIVIMLVASIFLLFTNVSVAEAATGEPESLTGEWIGTWTSLNAPYYNGVIEMSITQEGDGVSGTSLVGNTKCAPERFFTGKLSGKRGDKKFNSFIELEISPNDKRDTTIAKNWGAITRARNAISVVYSFNTPESACEGDVGTMFISKVQPYSTIKGIIK
ncbi:MAG: hypothetical protein F6J86_39425 [Symploca sp. SIO1B1]|nr:hypothetical protein [Symploca sp. SIO1B1]